MTRHHRGLGLLVVTVTLAPLAVSGAQLAVNSGGLGPLTPAIIRTDAPILPSADPDPSIANAFGFVTGTGVPLNGVANFIIPDPDDAAFIFSCTSARIGARSMLVAAHCVTDPNTGALFSTAGQAFVRFLGPGSTDAHKVFVNSPDALSIVVDPDWHGFNNPSTYLFHDFAVINFASDLPSFATTYDLFTDPSGLFGPTVTQVGYGTFGGPTGPENFDFGRRWGTNVIDAFGGDPSFNDFLDLYTDFDGPGGTFDSICLLGGPCDPATTFEAAIAEGDSGGPLFIDGKIAAINSFGTFLCDPANTTDCVPFNVADPSRPFDTYGSINGYAPVFAEADFIRGAEAPEPSTVILMATGLVMIAGVVRRRRSA